MVTGRRAPRGWRDAVSTRSESAPERSRLGHELVDHTSEVTMRLHAPTFSELVAEATRAFVELVPDSLRGEVRAEWRAFRIDAPDLAAGLVEWLNEIVYRCEADQWLPTEVEVEGGHDGEMRVRARGMELSAPFVLVKAATLHRAFVRPGADGLEAEVTLDV
jgi:SHS2 domain-containing protein